MQYSYYMYNYALYDHAMHVRSQNHSNKKDASLSYPILCTYYVHFLLLLHESMQTWYLYGSLLITTVIIIPPRTPHYLAS